MAKEHQLKVVKSDKTRQQQRKAEREAAKEETPRKQMELKATEITFKDVESGRELKMLLTPNEDTSFGVHIDPGELTFDEHKGTYVAICDRFYAFMGIQ